MLVAVDNYFSKAKQIVVAGQPGAPDTRALLNEIRSQYTPNKVVLLADGAEGQDFLSNYLPFIKGNPRFSFTPTILLFSKLL